MLAPPPIVATGPPEARVLFEQARRRRRRRRLAAALATIAAAGLITAGIGLAWPQHARPAAPGERTEPGRPSPAGRPAATVAWVDYLGRLHLGDVRNMAQRVVAHSTAYPVTPLVQARGDIYWVDTGGEYAIVRALDLATGRITDLGFGQSVFAAADGRHVFIAQTSTSLTEIAAGRAASHGRSLTVPAGWYVPGGESLSDQPVEFAAGITVQSAPDNSPAISARQMRFAAWNPDSGKLRALGTGVQLIDAVSGARDQGGLIALRLCPPPGACPVKIISTRTLATRTVRGPLPYGFAMGGAFAPDGSQLAVFINTGAESSQPAPVQLALVSTGTGAVRLVRGARFAIGIDIAWTRWLPGGKELIAGGLTATYLVNVKTLAVSPLHFSRGADHYIEDSQDVNYSAVVLPSLTR